MERPDRAAKKEAEVVDAFRLFDSDRDSRVNAEEIKSLIESLGGDLSCPQVQDLITACQQNSVKSLGLDEFLNHWRNFKSRFKEEDDSEEEILEAFKGYDLDSDGYITREEMVQALARMGTVINAEEEAEKCMQEMDLDRDGRVSYAEFLIKWRVT